MPNSTLNYLQATLPVSTLCFSGALTTASVYLNGPGNQAGNGFPMLHAGYIQGFAVWDGTSLHTDQTEVSFVVGDKISVYCQNVGTSYTIRIRVNGGSSAIQITGVPLNTTVFATLEILLINR
jgi:hypothetical protein